MISVYEEIMLEERRQTRTRLNKCNQIDEDLLCTECGYNLRGLSVENTCPECGMRIGVSRRGIALRFCDPLWLALLTDGARWLAIGCVAQAALIAGVTIGSVLFPGAPAFRVALWITLIPTVLFILHGFDKLTSHNAEEDESLLNIRRLPRIFFFIAGMGTLATTLLTLSPPVRILIRLFIATPFFALSAILLLAYLRKLARRIPHLRLARHTTLFVWSAILMGLLMFLVEGFMQTVGLLRGVPPAPTSTPANLMGTYLLFVAVYAVPQMLFFLACAWLMKRYHKVFSLTLRQARGYEE